MVSGSGPELMEDFGTQKKIRALLVKARKYALFEINPTTIKAFEKSLDNPFSVEKKINQRKPSANSGKKPSVRLPSSDMLRLIAAVGEPRQLPGDKLPTVREVIQASLAFQTGQQIGTKVLRR